MDGLTRPTKGTGTNGLCSAASALFSKLLPCIFLLPFNNGLHKRRHVLVNSTTREPLSGIKLKLLGLRFLETGKRVHLLLFKTSKRFGSASLKLRFPEGGKRINLPLLKPCKRADLRCTELLLRKPSKRVRCTSLKPAKFSGLELRKPCLPELERLARLPRKLLSGLNVASKNPSGLGKTCNP